MRPQGERGWEDTCRRLAVPGRGLVVFTSSLHGLHGGLGLVLQKESADYFTYGSDREVESIAAERLDRGEGGVVVVVVVVLVGGALGYFQPHIYN